MAEKYANNANETRAYSLLFIVYSFVHNIEVISLAFFSRTVSPADDVSSSADKFARIMIE